MDKVNFIFGPYSSAITFATSAIGEKYHVITIAPEANAVNIYERGYKYIFSVLPPATLLMAPIAEMAEKLNPKPKTVAIIMANDLFPISCAEGFRDKCKELGFEVVLFEKYPAGATDISTLLTKVKGLNPDILAISGYTQDSLMVIRQCKELNVNPKMYAFAVGVMVPAFVQELGADAEYAFEGEWWLPTMKLSDKIFGTTADYGETNENGKY
jgi:branched-chain amino acid transport system substrate-binding protein